MKNLLLTFAILFVSVFTTVSAQAPWTRHSPFPSAAKILDLESDHSGRIFALTAESEIFYSVDSGMHWDAVADVFSFWNILDIEVDEVTGTLYVGTTGNGITWTSDLGQNWNQEYIYTNSVSGFHATFFKVGVRHGSNIIVGSEPDFTSSPIYTSLNGGASWIVQPVAPFAGAIDLQFLPGGVLLAACEAGVYSSPDNGASWSPLNNGIAAMQTRALAFDHANGIWYAATDINVQTGDTAGAGVYISVNAGASWTLSSTGIINPRVTEVLTDSLTGDVYALSPDGVYRSSNNGSSWQLVNSGLNVLEFSSADQLPSGEIAIGSVKEGVAFSHQPQAGWTFRNEGLAGKDFSSMIVNRNHLFLLGEESGTIYRKSISDTVWQQPGGIQIPALTRGAYLRNDSAGNLYAIYEGWDTTVHVMRSPDNGDTWSLITTPIALPIGATAIQFLDFKVAPGGILYLLANYKGLLSTVMDVYKSTDGGITWNSILQIPGGNLISASAIDVAHGGEIYISAFTNSFTHTVILSVNHGATFTTFPIPPVTFGSFYDIMPDQNGMMLFSFNNELKKRVGSSWVSIPNGGWSTDFNSHPIRLYIDAVNNYYVTGLDDGAFFSSNTGTSWTNITAGLPLYNSAFGLIRLTITSMSFDSLNNPFAMSSDDEIDAAPYRGIYTRTITTEIAENAFASPGDFTVFPNPSDGMVAVCNAVAASQMAEITVTDLQGRIVKKMKVSFPLSGKIELQLLDINPGCYLLSISTADSRSAIKLIKY